MTMDPAAHADYHYETLQNEESKRVEQTEEYARKVFLYRFRTIQQYNYLKMERIKALALFNITESRTFERRVQYETNNAIQNIAKEIVELVEISGLHTDDAINLELLLKWFFSQEHVIQGIVQNTHAETMENCQLHLERLNRLDELKRQENEWRNTINNNHYDPEAF